MICTATVDDMREKFEGQVMSLTIMELKALQFICEIYMMEEEE